MTTDPVQAGNTEKRLFLRSAEKWNKVMIIKERQLFSLNNFFRVWPEHGELEEGAGLLYDTQNTFHLIVKGLKNAFLMSLTPLLYRYLTVRKLTE